MMPMPIQQSCTSKRRSNPALKRDAAKARRPLASTLGLLGFGVVFSPSPASRLPASVSAASLPGLCCFARIAFGGCGRQTVGASAGFFVRGEFIFRGVNYRLGRVVILLPYLFSGLTRHSSGTGR